MSELKATTAQEIVRNEKDCDYMDELFGGVKMPPTQVYLKSEADKVIAELKAQVNAHNNRANLWHYNALNEHNATVALRMENAKLKAKLEDVQKSAYAECVDAGMRGRRLKRALWLARASEAVKEVNYWTCQDESSYAIVDFNVRHETIISYKAPHHRPYKWILIWENVERKCRAMAERYK